MSMARARRKLGPRQFVGPSLLIGVALLTLFWSPGSAPSSGADPGLASLEPAWHAEVRAAEAPVVLETAALPVQPESVVVATDPRAAAAPLAPARPRLAPGAPRWVRSVRETGLWSGPREGQEFTKLDGGSTLRVLERQGERYRVLYAGDEELRRSGEAWVNLVDSNEADWPKFVRTRMSAVLRTEPSEASPVVLGLPPRTYLEVLETSGRDWARVFLAARPDTGEPLEAWIDGEDVLATPRDPGEYLEYTLTRAQLASRAPEVWLRVPYRSQLDGSSYEAANCGPTVLWMALQRTGRPLPPPGVLRSTVLQYQEIDVCDDCGVFIEHLSAVAEQQGAIPVGLFDGGSESFRRWTAEDIRSHLRAGRVVVPQVMYRFLSGRERSDYWGDHYVVITGFTGEHFIYHDPIDTRGPGSSRLISPERLMKAMENSDYPFAAFALGI